MKTLSEVTVQLDNKGYKNLGFMNNWNHKLIGAKTLHPYFIYPNVPEHGKCYDSNHNCYEISIQFYDIIVCDICKHYYIISR